MNDEQTQTDPDHAYFDAERSAAAAERAALIFKPTPIRVYPPIDDIDQLAVWDWPEYDRAHIVMGSVTTLRLSLRGFRVLDTDNPLVVELHETDEENRQIAEVANGAADDYALDTVDEYRDEYLIEQIHAALSRRMLGDHISVGIGAESFTIERRTLSAVFSLLEFYFEATQDPAVQNAVAASPAYPENEGAGLWELPYEIAETLVELRNIRRAIWRKPVSDGVADLLNLNPDGTYREDSE